MMINLPSGQSLDPRTIAKRWAWSQMTEDMFGWGPANPGPIADEERESLFAWVRTRVDRDAETLGERDQEHLASIISRHLGIGAWDLCKAAGCWS